jgi:hypothetical protein
MRRVGRHDEGIQHRWSRPEMPSFFMSGTLVREMRVVAVVGSRMATE